MLVNMQTFTDLEAIGVRNRKHQSVLLKAVKEVPQGWEEHYPDWLPAATEPEPEPEPEPD
jgi:hypothetical protein